MNNRSTSARVLQVIAIIVRRQERIHHRDDYADPRRTKPGPNKLGTIRQNNQHAIFHLNPDFAQRITRAIRHAGGFTVSESLIAEVETGFIFAPFLYIVVEEVIGHVEAFREFDHSIIALLPTNSLGDPRMWHTQIRCPSKNHSNHNAQLAVEASPKPENRNQ